MNNIKFPLWFNVLTILLIISNLFIFGIFSLIHPELPWPDLGQTAAFPIQFFAIRHIAFAVILLHGFLKKNPTTLRALYHMFFIIAVLDVSLLAINDYYIPVLYKFIGEVSVVASVAIGTALFIIPMAIGARHLRTYKEA